MVNAHECPHTEILIFRFCFSSPIPYHIRSGLTKLSISFFSSPSSRHPSSSLFEKTVHSIHARVSATYRHIIINAFRRLKCRRTKSWHHRRYSFEISTHCLMAYYRTVSIFDTSACSKGATEE